MQGESVILIADDERHNVELLVGILRGPKYRFEIASNGEEALQKAASCSPDLLLLDVMMPKMDGFEVCRRIRQDPRLNQLPVIMVTALDDRDARRKAIEVGADDLLQKPVDRQEVRMRVHSVTRLQRYRSFQAEHQKFEQIADLAPDGYVVIGEDGRITYTNRQARHLMGLSDPSANGTPFIEQLQKQFQADPQSPTIDWSKALSGTRENPFQIVFPETATSFAAWVQVDVIPSEASDLVGTLVRLSDVTSNVSLQRDLWKFHSQMSHKLRTPLVGVVGALDLLELDDAVKSKPDTHELVEMGRSCLGRLQNGVEEILRYLDAPSIGRQERSVTIEDVPFIIQKAAADVGITQVQSIIPPELGPTEARISPTALELALVELFRNSRKFHPQKNPCLKVTLERLNTTRLVLRVEDDGTHLSPERLSKVWLPYYQNEKNPTGEIDGMGLGLSMIASMVRECGGTCRMYNRTDHPGVAVEIQVSTLLDK